MKNRRTLYNPVAVWTVFAALVCGAWSTVGAQSAELSPVPKEPCCFNNFRYSGTCQVTPRQGQLCRNILNYLNNLSSSGEPYCRSTTIRGGWTEVDCASGEAAGEIGQMPMKNIQVQEADRIPATSPSAGRSSSIPTVEPSTLQVTQANVLKVRLEQPLSDDGLVQGQELQGRLEADVLGPDGEVLAPAGSTISATVGAEAVWDQAATSPASPQLRLVGTTTSAADLFGTAEPTRDVAAVEGAAPAIHLTGNVVELTDDSVVSLELHDISSQPADLRVLTTATRVWTDAFNARDAVTIAGLSSDDGALLPPNGRAIIGRDAILDYWSAMLADTSTRVTLVNVETVVQGDLGYKAGKFELVDAGSGTQVEQGKYIQIWKRSPQGYWELHRDIWNSSLRSD